MVDPGRLAEQEIEHSRRVAARCPEMTWGWETPAGRIRARRRADLIAASVGLRADMCVLEIGCGTGLFTAMIAQTGAALMAIDISEELLVEKAKARGLPEDRVRFLRGRFENHDPGGPFDAVIGSSVLHHLDIGVALARIHALLTPGGAMCFAEPNMLNPQVCLERFCRRWFPYVSPQETAFVA